MVSIHSEQILRRCTETGQMNASSSDRRATRDVARISERVPRAPVVSAFSSTPPRVLLVEDDPGTRTMLCGLLEQRGFAVSAAGGGKEALELLEGTEFDVVLSDLRMPDLDGLALLEEARRRHPDLVVILMTGSADVQTAVRAMQQGAADYLTKPLEMDELTVVIDRALENGALRREAADLRTRLTGRLRVDNLVGSSPVMQEVFKIVEQLAPSRASVLITGESGTGKELIAQALHENGPRARAPFVKLHCAALSETLLESELFGHEKGAFTGGTGRREGRFKQADGGTLFLDEIGDISPAVQVKLLRFLQERTFERVGGNETLKVDVRVIAATNQDLVAEVNAGRFREDLYYRLNVVKVEIPPLRARPNDVLPLATYFLARFVSENKKRVEGFDAAATERILTYRWPGNVRELENAVERAVVVCSGTQITAEDLPHDTSPATKGVVRIPGSTMEEIERHAIVSTLEACGGRTAQAAQMLNLSVRTIQYKQKEYGIPSERALAASRK
jgi:two-component system response regulator HydG